jgi:NTP pyrophosphatase (non-canonical NTP hydrolase)
MPVPMGGNDADIRVIAKAIRNWADEIMPNRQAADAIKKLSMEEVPELWRALKEYGTVDEGEIADVLILALDICELSRIDPLDAIANKMIVNMGRTWKFEHGVMQHDENK